MIEIGMHKVYKNFGYKQVVQNISFEILTGERVGIVGKNGSGKSTLLRMIIKEEFPDSGSITIRRDATIGYLEQIPAIDNEEITVRTLLMSSFQEVNALEEKMHALEIEMMHDSTNEVLLDKYAKIQSQYIYQGGYEIEEKIHKVINGFQLESLLDKSFSILSGGQKTIVNLARLILTEPDILLLDEPTNHLDIKMIVWLENYLNRYQGTVIIISHDRYFLDKITNKTVLLDSGESQVFHGNYSYSLKEQERLLLLEFEQYKTQQKKIAAIKASIKRYRDWGNQGDNEKFFKKAKELEKRLDKMEVLEKPQIESKKLPIQFIGERSSYEVVRIKNLGISFHQEKLFSDVTLTLYYQEKIALLGNNGSGKTSFIKAIIGELLSFEGQLEVSKTTKLGYIPQEIHFINESDSILESFRKECPCLEGEARSYLAKYSFYKDQVFRCVGKLSGGEKVLLKLAILMQKQVNFLVLDEPTNHIDIETREILEQALLDYQGTLLFVSHDRYFIEKLAKRRLVIENGTIISSYNEYQ